MVPISNTPGGNETHVIQELMNRADQRGFVTFEDVLELLDEDSDDVNAIEAVLDELDELGIELRQHDLVQVQRVDQIDLSAPDKGAPSSIRNLASIRQFVYAGNFHHITLLEQCGQSLFR